MVFHTVSSKFLHFLLFCLGRAGVTRCGFWLWVLAPLPLFLVVGPVAAGQPNDDRVATAGMTSFDARQAMHREEAWLSIASHLPDPATASGDKLEVAGDVLRARRYTQDALDYYMDALRRGGNEERIMVKLGVTELELRQPARAKAYFKLVVKRDKKNAEAWNNLGATEYIDGQFSSSVSDYRKAIKLNPKSAVFHVNLATAFVEHKSFEEARQEFTKAYDLDPELGLHRGETAGIAARILSADDHARFCFEMARMYATRGKIDEMMHSLASASESGMDLGETMPRDSVMSKYAKDPQVLLLMQNARALKRSSMAGLTEPLVPLPAAAN